MSLNTDPRPYGGYIDLSTFYTTEEVDCFSNTGRGNFKFGDRSLLKYYKPPATTSFNFNLMKGYTPLNEIDEGIEGKLKALKRSNIERNAEFLCRRGLLTEICNLPYEKQNEFSMSVVRYEGTFFLMNEREKSEYPIIPEMIFVGYKFQQYVTEDQNGMSDTDAPIDVDQGFYTIVEGKLDGKHSLLMTNEVDCVARDTNKYVELKTAAVMEVPERRHTFYRFKIKTAWAKSYLVGTEKILFGFRNKTETVTEVKEFEVAKLPQLAFDKLKELAPSWKPWEASVCLKFLSTFLDFIKENVTQDESVCLLNRKPGGPVRIKKLQRGDDKYESLMEMVKTA